MHPVLFHFGPLTLRWYGVMMGLALFLSVPITAYFGGQFGLSRVTSSRSTSRFRCWRCC